MLTTSLYVTHDQDEAMTLSDRIVVMNRGRVEQVGTPSEIYLRPASVFVADFIGRAGFLPCPAGRVTAEGARVRLLRREIVVPAHPRLAEGDDAVLMVRPESVTLKPCTENADGTVLSASYLGPTVEYEVETMAGPLLVSAPAPDPTGLLSEGSHVQVTLAEERCYLLPALAEPARSDLDVLEDHAAAPAPVRAPLG